MPCSNSTGPQKDVALMISKIKRFTRDLIDVARTAGVMKGILPAILLMTFPAVAQNYSLPNNNSGCPSNCRVIPWQTGSDLWNGGSLPVYQQVTCSPLQEDGATDDSANINACIAAASAGSGAYATCHAAGGCAVYLPAGTIYINGKVTVKSNVVLRGAGPGSTIIKQGGNGLIDIGTFSHSNDLNPGTSYASMPSTFLLSGNPQKGDTTVTCSTGCSNVKVGTWIKIFGNDDPSLIGDSMSEPGSISYYKCDQCGDNSGYYLMQQTVQVTGISGSTWTLSRPLYYTPYTAATTVYDSNNSAVTEPAGAKYNIITFNTVKAGLEYLRVWGASDLGANQNVLMQGCLYCWVKGIDVAESGSQNLSAMMETDWSYGGEIRDSYFHDQRSGSGGAGYGIYFQFPSSDVKVENNIVRHSRHGTILQGGGSGIAFLYNYVDDGYTDDLTYLASARFDHGAHPFMDLYEGNIYSHLVADEAWGTSSHMVLYRNWIWGDATMNWSTSWANLLSGVTSTLSGLASLPSGSNPANGFDAISLYTGQSYYSLVGNVLGHSGLHTTWSSGTVKQTPCGDNYVRTAPVAYDYCGVAGTTGPDGYRLLHSTAPGADTTALDHGNWDYVTNGVAYWDGGSNHNLAPSLYYSSEPAFLTSAQKPWPLEGPEGNPTINSNPAEDCWLKGPATGAAFNPSSCYSYSASSSGPGIPQQLSGSIVVQ